MQRSGNQKLLLILSLVKILFAVILVVAGALTSIASLVGAAASAELESAGALSTFGRILIIFACVAEFFVGLFGMRASNDDREVLPVWFLALIDIALLGISCILAIVSGTSAISIVFFVLSLVVSAFIFWISNDLKGGPRLR